MLRSKIVSIFIFGSFALQPFAHALDENECESKLTPSVNDASVTELLVEAQKQIELGEAQAKKECKDDAACFRQKSASSVQRALQWLGSKTPRYVLNKIDVMTGRNIRTVPGTKRDFWMLLPLIYTFQTIGKVAFELRKGTWNISDFHFDLYPTTFVKLWMQKETQSRNTSALHKEVLTPKDIEEMKSGMKGFMKGALKAYAGDEPFWAEVSKQMKGFIDLLPWGAGTMIAFRLGEAALRPDLEFDMTGVKTDILLTVIFDGYLAVRWSAFDSRMVPVYDALKRCSTETCFQKSARLAAEFGQKGSFMLVDNFAFFWLRESFLPWLVENWTLAFAMLIGG
jgi:hypothetical protein